MSRGGWGGRAVAVLAVAVLAFAPGAGPAAAHDELTGTDPADGSTVDVAPDRVVLTFAEPALELGTEVLVTGPDGATVSEGAVVLDGTTVSQALAATRPAGAYRVDWRVTSDDGHPVTGTFTFTATTAVPAPTPSGTPSPDDTTTPADETTTPADDTTTPADGGITTTAEPADEDTAPAGVGATEPSPDAGAVTGGGHPGLTAGVVVAAVILVLLAATLGRRASLRHKARAGTRPAEPPSTEG